MNDQSQISNLKPQIKLKVCGLTKVDQIQELISLKIDCIGFIFYEKSPRYVLNHLTLKEISEISHNGKVGVFVNETVENIVEISNEADLNFIQLHGNENEEFILNLRKKLNENIQIIKVIKIPAVIPRHEEPQRFFTALRSVQNDIDYFLFDTDSSSYGGTGKSFDWTILNQIDNMKPYFLSGGISMENIGEIRNINQKPFALDINSKFETEPGIKDLEKIRNFIHLIQQ